MIKQVLTVYTLLKQLQTVIHHHFMIQNDAGATLSAGLNNVRQFNCVHAQVFVRCSHMISLVQTLLDHQSLQNKINLS